MLSWSIQDINVLIRGKWEGQGEGSVTIEAEVGMLSFEDGDRHHKPSIAGDPWKLEADSLLKPTEGIQLNWYLDFSS